MDWIKDQLGDTTPSDRQTVEHLAGELAKTVLIGNFLRATDAYIEAQLEEDQEFILAKTAATSRTDNTALRMARIKTKGRALRLEAEQEVARWLLHHHEDVQIEITEE